MNTPSDRPNLGIGLISGTSADGVDTALVRIGLSFLPQIEVTDFRSAPYSDDLRRCVLMAYGESGATSPETARFTIWWGKSSPVPRSIFENQITILTAFTAHCILMAVLDYFPSGGAARGIDCSRGRTPQQNANAP